jgi:hypothetical protein
MIFSIGIGKVLLKIEFCDRRKNMQKGQPHPAATVSKTMLANRLVELIKKKSYSDITITELCAYSQIARRTFYFETQASGC